MSWFEKLYTRLIELMFTDWIFVIVALYFIVLGLLVWFLIRSFK